MHIISSTAMKNGLNKKSRRIINIAFLLLLSGCATVSQDAGFSDTVSIVHKRIEQQPIWHRSKLDLAKNQSLIQSLLSQSLSADNAVRIALMNNAGLQLSLNELGIAQADLVQAGRIHNPSLSYLRVSQDEQYEIERRILFDVMGVLTMPLRVAIEKRRFEQAKIHAAIEILQFAAETKKAFYRAVAAQQIADYREQIKDAAEASALLALRMAQVGNLNKQEQAREQAFYAEAMGRFAQANLLAMSEREHLIQLMGLWGEQTQFQLPKRLPELPLVVQDIPEIEQQTLLNRLDIQVLKYKIEGTAKALGLTKATRFIDVLELGYARDSSKSEDERLHLDGYEISLQVPLFDWGGAKVARAEAIYMQSVWQLHELAVNARSEARQAYYAYRATYDLSKHYRDEVVPLRKNIFDESLLRYNGMLIGTFELLADAREQITSVNNYIEFLLNFWLADTELQTAIMVRSPNNNTLAAITDNASNE